MAACNCTQAIRLSKSKRDRVIAFVPTAKPARWWGEVDVVFTAEAPPEGVTRYGRAFVACACEPGYTRIGASTAVLYGRNGPKLLEAFEAVTEPILVVALHGDSPTEGRAIAEIERRIAAEAETEDDELPRRPRTLLVVSFADGPIVRTHALEEPRAQVVRHRRPR